MKEFNWDMPPGTVPWVKERTIYLTRHGSHAYGTSLPTSDLDIRGICIAPKEYYFGYDLKFEQTDAAVTNEDEAPDLVIFELRKFMKLAAVCNPNALEIIFTSPEDHILVTPAAEILFDNRDKFLSRLALRTFSGYAASQMRRIEGHYRWLKNPPKGKPEREDFDLPPHPEIPTEQLEAVNAGIQKKLDQWNLNFLKDLEPAYRIEIKEAMFEMLTEMQIHMDDLWKGAARSFGFDENFIEYLKRERQFTAKAREWKKYQKWVATRNPARAALEAKWGYDTKHAMHLVRLLRMCREVLTTGVLHVRRPDAADLLEIRNGSWAYEDLVAWANALNRELAQLVLTSPLPAKPNNRALDRVCMTLVESSFA
jgi:hypothetical protein